ncbi:MAG: dephospho-CoA kinase [Niabella sp.]
MLKIGLTGGIGSGKTTIAKIFSTLGIPVYDADSAAKNLIQTSETIRKAILETFGSEVYKNGQLDRNFLSSVVFNNEEKLQQLNAIVHPVTIADSIGWFNRQKAPYAIKEAALIFESGSEKYLDYVIGVRTPEALRIERILQRGGITRVKIKKRMAQQMNDDEKMDRCDFVIDNSGQVSVLQQVVKIHEQLQEIALKQTE